MESANICKYCKCKIDDDFKESECKQKSFAELVNDSKNSETNETELHIAAESGQLEMLKWLVSEGCDVHYVDKKGNNALYKATLNGHFNCIQYLVHKNVDINSLNAHTRGTMFYAAHSKNIDIVKFLVAHGGDIHGTHGYDKNTLLHAAANNFEMIHLLVSLGVDINARNFHGESIIT
jgi:ankyrin repeat protein